MAVTLNCGLTKTDIELAYEALSKCANSFEIEYKKCVMMKDMPDPPEDHIAYASFHEKKEKCKLREKELLVKIKESTERSILLQAKLISIKNSLKEGESCDNVASLLTVDDLSVLFDALKEWENERAFERVLCQILKEIPEFPLEGAGMIGAMLHVSRQIYNEKTEQEIEKMRFLRRERSTLLSAKILMLKQDMAIEQLFTSS
jgi:hypothetical protein